MDEIRLNRIRSMMKDELSLLINRELKDPRIPFVTVTDVQITRDVKQATVYFSVMSAGQASDPEVAASCQLALENARGFLRKQLSIIMQLRFVPGLLFKEDKGLENTMRVSELLKQINDEKKNAPLNSPEIDQTEPSKSKV